jgi:hypothetical protein
VHAPAGEQRLRLSRRQVAISERTRGGEYELDGGEAVAAECGERPGGSGKPLGRRRLAAVQAQERRAEATEQAMQLGPARRIVGMVAGEPLERPLGSLVDPQARSARVDVRERTIGVRVAEAEPLELLASGGVERAAGEPALVRREDVVDEPGERQLGAANRSADLVRRLEDDGAPAGAPELRGADETVVPGADDDRVVCSLTPNVGLP